MSSEIQPVMNMGGFGEGWMGIFGLLVLLGILNGGGGFGFGGNGNTNAIQADVNRGFDAQNLQAQTRDILAAVTNGTAQIQNTSNMNAANAINAVKDGNAALIREFGNVETALTALSGKQQECCCNILRAIDANTYNQAEQTQKILDAISANRIADMQNQINQLQLQQAMCGVVRYPVASTWNAGPYPPVTTAAASG